MFTNYKFLLTAIRGWVVLKYSKDADFYKRLDSKFKANVEIDENLTHLLNEPKNREMGGWMLNKKALESVPSDLIKEIKLYIEEGDGEFMLDPQINWAIFKVDKKRIEKEFSKSARFLIDTESHKYTVTLKSNSKTSISEMAVFFDKLQAKYPNDIRNNNEHTWEFFDIDPLKIKGEIENAGGFVTLSENIKPYKKVVESKASVGRAINIVDNAISEMSLMEIQGLKFRINKIEHEKIKLDRQKYGIYYIAEHNDIIENMTDKKVEIRLSTGNVISGTVASHSGQIPNFTIILDNEHIIEFSCAGILLIQ